MAITTATSARTNNHAGLIWAIADLLRGDYKPYEYGKAILPLVVLRRLDCVLEPTKDQVRFRLAALEGRLDNVGPVLQAITGLEVYNTSPLTLRKILADPAQVAGNLRAWIAAFDPETRDVIEKFEFDAQIGQLDRAKLLYLVLSKVTEVDLHPDIVSNVEVGVDGALVADGMEAAARGRSCRSWRADSTSSSTDYADDWRPRLVAVRGDVTWVQRDESRLTFAIGPGSDGAEIVVRGIGLDEHPALTDLAVGDGIRVVGLRPDRGSDSYRPGAMVRIQLTSKAADGGSV